MATFPSDSVRTKNWSTEVLTDADLEGQFDVIHNYIKAALDASTGHAHDGTSNNGPKISPANLLIASQAAGDTLYASSASAWARLPKGTAGQVLKMNSGATAPEWGAGSTAASQADQETGTEDAKYVAPATQQFHQSASKAWCVFDGTSGSPTVSAGFNVDSAITKNGTGDYTISWTTDFSSANYAVCAIAKGGSGGSDPLFVNIETIAAGSIRIEVSNHDAILKDSAYISVVAFGDQGA